ncbi:MAG: alpha/beta hydrolase [Candidatus Competibacteraceae bacterium]|nr:alpha/beta hydrolase [Candidatus Competibacteraceae bacterium]HRY16354.1 alpha/beta hydrolase [Candidatus Competibacteraceae bacterium]
MKFVHVNGIHLEYIRLPSAHPREGAPAIIFLHEGLGSVSLWRSFPQQVADTCGCEAVIYSREGYGHSDPAPAPRTPRYLHRQGVAVLPALIDALELDRPLLLGHSDGASIALLCAGETATPLSGLIVMAPHVMVEEITLAGIRQAAQGSRATDLQQRLSRYHSATNAATVVTAWRDIWLDPAFRDWNIESCLPMIRCPILAIQGEDDEYATMEQIDRIVAQAPDVDLLKLADCRHAPHWDQPQAVIDAIVAFVDRVVEKPLLSDRR